MEKNIISFFKLFVSLSFLFIILLYITIFFIENKAFNTIISQDNYGKEYITNQAKKTIEDCRKIKDKMQTAIFGILSASVGFVGGCLVGKTISKENNELKKEN